MDEMSKQLEAVYEANRALLAGGQSLMATPGAPKFSTGIPGSYSGGHSGGDYAGGGSAGVASTGSRKKHQRRRPAREEEEDDDEEDETEAEDEEEKNAEPYWGNLTTEELTKWYEGTDKYGVYVLVSPWTSRTYVGKAWSGLRYRCLGHLGVWLRARAKGEVTENEVVVKPGALESTSWKVVKLICVCRRR